MIRVLFQGQDNRWQDFKIEVENLSNAPELFSHAAMCPEKIVDPKIADQGMRSRLCDPTKDTDKA